jgi:opacity protein-like surface antigen
MKKLLIASVLALGVASPALAQSYDPSIGSGNLVPSAWAHGPAAYHGAPYEAFGWQPVVNPRRARAAWYDAYGQVGNARFWQEATTVYSSDGRYLGADPDPRIRRELLRSNGYLD